MEEDQVIDLGKNIKLKLNKVGKRPKAKVKKLL